MIVLLRGLFRPAAMAAAAGFLVVAAMFWGSSNPTAQAVVTPDAGTTITPAPSRILVDRALLTCPGTDVDEFAGTTTVVAAAPAGVGPAGAAGLVNGAVTIAALPPATPLEKVDYRGIAARNAMKTAATLSAWGTGSGAPGLTAWQLTRTAAGPDRGLAAVSCAAAATDWWFMGASAVSGRRDLLVLSNPLSVKATLNITAWTPTGPLTPAAGQAVQLQPGVRVALSLAGLFSAQAALAVHVSATEGKVTAAIRDAESVTIRGATVPRGFDWIPAVPAPATVVVIPGVPSGASIERTLSVLAPAGGGTATVEVLGKDGAYRPVALPSVPLPAGRVAVLDVRRLGGVADTSTISLRLVADVPLVAAVRYRLGGVANGVPGITDTGWAAAAPLLTGPTIGWAYRLGTTRTASFAITTADPNGADASVRFKVRGAPGDGTLVTIPAGRTVSVAAPGPPGQANFSVIDITPTTPGSVAMAWTMTETGARGRFVAQLTLSTAIFDLPSASAEQDQSALLVAPVNR